MGRRANVAAAFVGAAIALPVGLLLERSLFQGEAQSFDSLLYARSLWGLAHGASENPIAGVHALAIHGHFIGLLLVPFARFAAAGRVLLVAQSLALFATVFLVARRAGELVEQGKLGATKPWATFVIASGVGVLATLGAPLVLNPFLFDARPDLLGVPFATYALLRAEETGKIDRRVIVAFVLALLAREELAMVVLGLVVFWHKPKEHLRVRGLLGAGALGWWGFYAFVLRTTIGGDAALTRLSSTPAALLGGPPTGMVMFLKLEIIAATIFGMGALCLLGWRWLGAAIPGLVFVLAQNRLAGLVIDFHYGMFVAPGILVAGIAGLQVLSKQKRRVPIAAAIGVIGTILYLFSSTAPGGRRFRRSFFQPAQRVTDARALLKLIPDGAPVAAPFGYAVPLADRTLVVPIEALVGHEVPGNLDWLVVPASLWPTFGRFAIEERGFHLVGLRQGTMAVLARREGDLSALARAPTCTEPIARFAELGLALCSVGRYDDGRALVIVQREGPAQRDAAVILVGQTPFGPMPLLGYDGVFNARDLPQGKAMRLLSRAPRPTFTMGLRAAFVGDDLTQKEPIELKVP